VIYTCKAEHARIRVARRTTAGRLHFAARSIYSEPCGRERHGWPSRGRIGVVDIRSEGGEAGDDFAVDDCSRRRGFRIASFAVTLRVDSLGLHGGFSASARNKLCQGWVRATAKSQERPSRESAEGVPRFNLSTLDGTVWAEKSPLVNTYQRIKVFNPRREHLAPGDRALCIASRWLVARPV
jgi:hypothetical protein